MGEQVGVKGGLGPRSSHPPPSAERPELVSAKSADRGGLFSLLFKMLQKEGLPWVWVRLGVNLKCREEWLHQAGVRAPGSSLV